MELTNIMLKKEGRQEIVHATWFHLCGGNVRRMAPLGAATRRGTRGL